MRYIKDLLHKAHDFRFAVFENDASNTKEKYVAVISPCNLIDGIHEYISDPNGLEKQISYLLDAPWFPYVRAEEITDIANKMSEKLDQVMTDIKYNDIIDKIIYIIRKLNKRMFTKNILNKEYDFVLRGDYKSITTFKNLYMYDIYEISEFLSFRKLLEEKGEISDDLSLEFIFSNGIDYYDDRLYPIDS